MIPVRKCKEGHSFTHTFSFYNSSWVLTAPSNARYRVDCLTTGTQIRDWTTIAAASQITVSLTDDDNEIQDQRNQFETRQLTIQGDYSTDSQTVQTHDWDVENVLGIS